MAGGHGPSLYKLIRRLAISFSLIILGSWALLLPRLLITDKYIYFTDPKNKFYFDLGGLSAVFLGCLLVIYCWVRLRPRLKRVEDMGEGNW